MRAIKCDRCGNFEVEKHYLFGVEAGEREPYDGSLSFMHYSRSEHKWIGHDLCESCRLDLENWWMHKDAEIHVPSVFDGESYVPVEDEPKEEPEVVKVEDMGFIARACRVLRWHDYETFDDIKNDKELTVKKLYSFRNAGKKVVENIVDTLAMYGVDVPNE